MPPRISLTKGWMLALKYWEVSQVWANDGQTAARSVCFVSSNLAKMVFI